MDRYLELKKELTKEDYMKEYYQKNKEKRDKYNREYYEKNKENEIK